MSRKAVVDHYRLFKISFRQGRFAVLGTDGNIYIEASCPAEETMEYESWSTLAEPTSLLAFTEYAIGDVVFTIRKGDSTARLTSGAKEMKVELTAPEIDIVVPEIGETDDWFVISKKDIQCLSLTTYSEENSMPRNKCISILPVNGQVYLSTGIQGFVTTILTEGKCNSSVLMLPEHADAVVRACGGEARILVSETKFAVQTSSLNISFPSVSGNPIPDAAINIMWGREPALRWSPGDSLIDALKTISSVEDADPRRYVTFFTDDCLRASTKIPVEFISGCLATHNGEPVLVDDGALFEGVSMGKMASSLDEYELQFHPLGIEVPKYRAMIVGKRVRYALEPMTPKSVMNYKKLEEI